MLISIAIVHTNRPTTIINFLFYFAFSKAQNPYPIFFVKQSFKTFSIKALHFSKTMPLPAIHGQRLVLSLSTFFEYLLNYPLFNVYKATKKKHILILISTSTPCCSAPVRINSKKWLRSTYYRFLSLLQVENALSSSMSSIDSISSNI